MYSRKYIRPPIAAGNAPSERPTPPPDYAGIAFRASDERTVQDFPETVIPAAGDRIEKSTLGSSESIFLQDARPNTSFLSESDADEALGYEIPSNTPVASADETSIIMPQTDRVPTNNDEIPFLMPEESSLPEQAQDNARVLAPERSEGTEESEESEIDDQTAPPTEDGDGGASSEVSPLKWLRELKIEDLFLLWLLLMLLYGESNEEIDLLLSLLLFAGR